MVKSTLVHKVHNLRRLLNLISFQDRQVHLVYRQDGLQLHHQQVVEKELRPKIPRLSDYTRIRDIHRLNLFQYRWVMAKMMMISHQKEKGKDNGLGRVSE